MVLNGKPDLKGKKAIICKVSRFEDQKETIFQNYKHGQNY